MAVSVSDKQHRFMMAVAHSPEFAARTGVPQSVGEKFRRGDKAACYPMKDKSKCTGSAEMPKDYKRSRRRKRKMAGTALDGIDEIMKYDPSQPRWEAGTSGGKGGQFRPKSGSPLSQAMANMGVLSRTFQGVVDTSASKDKAQFMTAEALSGDPKAIAIRNFQQAFESAHQNRDVKLSSPEEVTRFIDDIATTMSKDLTTVLYREHDSDKFGYSKVSDIQRDMQAYSKELLQRLGGDDPVGTAAWARHRLNEIHPYADGVGKVVEVVADWVLMRSGMPLPKLSDKTRDEYFSAVNSGVEGFTQFYRERMPSRKAEGLSHVFKFNPYHDPKNGQFTTAGMASHTRARQEDLKAKGGSHRWIEQVRRLVEAEPLRAKRYRTQEGAFVTDRDSEGWYYDDPTAAVASSLLRELVSPEHDYDSALPGPILNRKRTPTMGGKSADELAALESKAKSGKADAVLSALRAHIENEVPLIGRDLDAKGLGTSSREGDHYLNGVLLSGNKQNAKKFSSRLGSALARMGFVKQPKITKPKAFQQGEPGLRNYEAYVHPESRMMYRGVQVTVISGMAQRNGVWEGEWIVSVRNPEGKRIMKYESVLKYNPYHDPKNGRFTDKATGGGGASYGQSNADYVKNYGRDTRNSWRNPGLEAMASKNRSGFRNPGLEAFAAKRRGKDQMDAFPAGGVKTNDLKKGTRVQLRNGWEAEIYDNKKGDIRMAKVYGDYTEIGSVYSHDIVRAHVEDLWVPVEHTDKQKKLRRTVGGLFG